MPVGTPGCRTAANDAADAAAASGIGRAVLLRLLVSVEGSGLQDRGLCRLDVDLDGLAWLEPGPKATKNATDDIGTPERPHGRQLG